MRKNKVEHHKNGSNHRRIAWVVVADSRTARIFQFRKGEKIIPLNISRRHPASDKRAEQELAPVEDGTINAESIKDFHFEHSQRGTTSSSVSSGHNTYEPKGDTEHGIMLRFVKNVALKLATAREERSFGRLVLVAPAKLLGELRKHLPPNVLDCIVAELPKDLAAEDEKGLLKHLHNTLVEARVV